MMIKGHSIKPIIRFFKNSKTTIEKENKAYDTEDGNWGNSTLVHYGEIEKRRYFITKDVDGIDAGYSIMFNSQEQITIMLEVYPELRVIYDPIVITTEGTNKKALLFRLIEYILFDAALNKCVFIQGRIAKGSFSGGYHGESVLKTFEKCGFFVSSINNTISQVYKYVIQNPTLLDNAYVTSSFANGGWEGIRYHKIGQHCCYSAYQKIDNSTLCYRIEAGVTHMLATVNIVKGEMLFKDPFIIKTKMRLMVRMLIERIVCEAIGNNVFTMMFSGNNLGAFERPLLIETFRALGFTVEEIGDRVQSFLILNGNEAA